MEPVSFIDPFAAEERPVIARPTGVPRIPAPPTNRSTSQALPSRRREREVQQLIHDLAALAAKNDPLSQLTAKGQPPAAGHGNE